MAVRKRLYGPAQVATGPTTVYTVPASRRATIRGIHLFNPSASAVTFTASIGADAAATRIYGAYSIPAGSPYDIFPGFIMEAAEILTLSAGTNNILVIVVSGEEEITV